MRRWRMLAAMLLVGTALLATHFGYQLLHTPYPKTAAIAWLLSIDLALLGLALAQDDGGQREETE
jgi:hypothetical protein